MGKHWLIIVVVIAIVGYLVWVYNPGGIIPASLKTGTS